MRVDWALMKFIIFAWITRGRCGYAEPMESTRIEIQTPISTFMENSGLDGSVNAIIRYEEDLYVGTSQGLYKLMPANYLISLPILKR